MAPLSSAWRTARSVGGVGVLSVERRDAHPSGWQQGGVEELGVSATPSIPRAAWTSAISPWVLPPSYEVSSRKMAAASPPDPLRRRQTFASRFRSPRVG